MKVIRDHDALYLEEDRKQQTKESFKFIVSKASAHLDQYRQPRIVDIGCATGDFLYYLKSLYPESILTGIDILPELLERAAAEVPGAEFHQGDVLQRETLPEGRFDAVFMSGVSAIFDDFRPCLENAIKLADRASDAMVFVFGAFNPDDVDVLIKVRNSAQPDDAPWQSGWNCFSRASVQRYLEELGVTSSRFHDFEIGIDLPRHKSDPLRSWTFRYEDGSRGIVNGAAIVHHFALLEIVP